MAQNKISARDAAIAVLNKAREMYQLSNLAKAESKHDRCVKDVERNSPDVKNAHAVCVAEGVKPAKWGKSEDGMNPDAASDAALGEKVEQDVQQHEEKNADPKHAMKGHIKLAKFVGRMEHKKGEKAKAMAKTDGQTLGSAIGFPGAPPTAPTAPPVNKGEK